MKLIGVVFTRLGGISRLAFVYRLPDGSIKKIPAGIGSAPSEKTKKETDMEKTLNTTTDCYGNEIPTAILTQKNGQLYLWEVVCHSSYDHNLGNCRCVNHSATEEYPISTTKVMNHFGVEVLDCFEAPGVEQLCFDTFGIEIHEMEAYLKTSYMLGINPLPALREKVSANTYIVFAESAESLAFPDAEPGTLIFVVNSRGEISVREV